MNKFLHFNVLLPHNASTKQRKRYQSRTAVVEPVSGKEVLQVAQKFLLVSQAQLEMQLNVGVTLLSLKDRYSKKEGREQATKRLATVSLKVTGVVASETHVIVELAEYKGVKLLLRMNKSTGNVTPIGTMTSGD